MKNTSRIVLFTSLFALMASHVYAGACEMKITRTACPGKEDISYKKCSGIPSCSEFVEVATVADCAAAATAACDNKRVEITKIKVIKAEFNGVAVNSVSGGDDLCADFKNKATEFNHCAQ